MSVGVAICNDCTLINIVNIEVKLSFHLVWATSHKYVFSSFDIVKGMSCTS